MFWNTATIKEMLSFMNESPCKTDWDTSSWKNNPSVHSCSVKGVNSSCYLTWQPPDFLVCEIQAPPPPLSLTHSQLVYRSTSHKQHLGQIKYLHSSTELGCDWTGVWLNWGVGARGNGSGGGRLPYIFSPTPSCFSSVQLYIIKMAIIPPEVC